MNLLRYQDLFESKKSVVTDEIDKVQGQIKSLKKDKKAIQHQHAEEIDRIKARIAELKVRKKKLLQWRKEH